MATAAQHVNTTEKSNRKRGGRLIPVIADGGDRAWVALVSFARRPRIGDTFPFRGLAWRIVREPDRLRGFVALPCTSRA